MGTGLKLAYYRSFTGSWCSRSLRLTEFQNIRHIKVVKLSTLCTVRRYTSGYTAGTSFWVEPSARVRPEELSEWKIPMTPSNPRPSGSCRLWDNVEKMPQSRSSHRRQYGAWPLHAGYLRLQKHSQNTQYFFLFCCNNGSTYVPQCYVIRTVPVLSVLSLCIIAYYYYYYYYYYYFTITTTTTATTYLFLSVNMLSLSFIWCL
jgi:hypothetical protein